MRGVPAVPGRQQVVPVARSPVPDRHVYRDRLAVHIGDLEAERRGALVEADPIVADAEERRLVLARPVPGRLEPEGNRPTRAGEPLQLARIGLAARVVLLLRLAREVERIERRRLDIRRLLPAS